MSIHHAYDYMDCDESNEMLDPEGYDIPLYEAETATEQLEYFAATMPHGIFSLFDIEGD